MADEPHNDAPDTEPEQAGDDPVAPAADATPEVDATAEADAAPEVEAEADVAPEVEATAEADATPEADAAPEVEPEPEAEVAAPEADAEAATAAPQAEPVEPVEQVPPKERRRRARSKHTDARPSRSPEERHAERLAERKLKATRRRARRLQERAKKATHRAAAPAPEALPPVHAPVEGARRVRQGIVVSDKAEKTITVRIDTARRHRRYEKIVRSSSTVHAHDENNDAHEGDTVRVIESRPLSRTKRWALVDVLERAR
jgi:small subunit ribosomal protein S17